jgi:chorismate lyase/3-hydroxybenzoate synthase
MSVTTGPQAKQKSHPQKKSPGVPPWVKNLIGRRPQTFFSDGFESTVTQGEDASLITLVLPHARELNAEHLEQRTFEAYRHLRSVIATLSHPHPVRFWNVLPDIHQQLDPARDRYMVFNAGRFRAFCEWFGEAGRFTSRLPAASAVGHDDDSLSIHCLTLARPGVAIENPRQISAFKYSSQYGPQPPCFARATIVDLPNFDRPILVTAGTASILGEDSVHPNHLERQLSESLENLRALIAQAQNKPSFESFIDMRVYHTRRQDAAVVENTIRRAIGPATPLQVIRADLCRSNLLVEIEGIARLERNKSL